MNPRRHGQSCWERLEPKITKHPDGCWLVLRNIADTGYVRIRDGKKYALAHRVSYEHHFGPIPSGLVIDHLCAVRNCVNPSHLEAVTNAENIRRGSAGEASRKRNLEKTHCPQGHPYEGENLYVNPGTGGRQCKTCVRASKRRYRDQLKAAP